MLILVKSYIDIFRNGKNPHYTENIGSAKKTGVHDAGTIDGRIQYHLSIPSLVWNGLTRKTGDLATDEANRLDCFLDMVKTMSEGKLDGKGCEASVSAETTGGNGKTKWSNVIIKASVEYDRACQELNYKLEGMLGDIELKRWNPRAHSAGRGGPREGNVGSHSAEKGGNDMDTSESAQPISPESAKNKLDELIRAARHSHGSLGRSITDGDVSKVGSKIKQMEVAVNKMAMAAINVTTTDRQRVDIKEARMFSEEAKIKGLNLLKATPKKGKKKGETPEKCEALKRNNSKTCEKMNENEKGKRGGAAIPPAASVSAPK
jgi:hypothetical protein